MARFVPVTLIAILASTAAQAQNEGPYTEAQAARGRELYSNACASCHGAALDGGAASPLAGAGFARRWNPGDAVGDFSGWGGGTVDDLYFVARTTMPPGNAGSLTDDEHLAVVAYILKRNGYAAGSMALSADPERLKAIPIAWHGESDRADTIAPELIQGSSGFQPDDEGYLPAALLNESGARPEDWLYHTRDYAGTRYSPLEQIDRDNAHELEVACVYQLGEPSNFQTGPVVFEGTMFLTTVRTTAAIDAATCQPKWRHAWSPRQTEVWRNNRGVAVANGRVVRGTADGYLLALDAVTGRLLWARRAADTRIGETFTMAPLIYDDLVVIGPAGSENAISGWVAAFSLADGEKVWEFKTVPGARSPDDPSWGNPNDIILGGGAVWTPLTLDPAREELYVAVSNPSPDLSAALRPGDNLYTNSVVALNVRTGALRWYEQLVPSDFHDWDLTQVGPLYRATIDGVERDVLTTAGKDGVLRTIDRNTHERWFEAEVTTRTNVDEPLDANGIRVCPGLFGGVQWNGPAFHPPTGTLIVPAVDWCATYFLADDVRFVPGKMYLGGHVDMEGLGVGHLTALDATDGARRWRYDSPRPMVAAVTTTAGGLVLTGEITGDFLVLDVDSGRELYRFHTGGPLGAGVVSYAVEDKQYIAAMSGRPSGFWYTPNPGSPTALVFTLRSDAP